ncbi:hypothetical protein O3P69_013192 [Scylla paramamosain]|uniref:Uncharacterized protein n=1 Tax=Scylla paramamosain TaxID=85552 RepID=A0AAW0TYZ4_SCYPA
MTVRRQVGVAVTAGPCSGHHEGTTSGTKAITDVFLLSFKGLSKTEVLADRYTPVEEATEERLLGGASPNPLPLLLDFKLHTRCLSQRPLILYAEVRLLTLRCTGWVTIRLRNTFVHPDRLPLPPRLSPPAALPASRSPSIPATKETRVRSCRPSSTTKTAPTLLQRPTPRLYKFTPTRQAARIEAKRFLALNATPATPSLFGSHRRPVRAPRPRRTNCPLSALLCPGRSRTHALSANLKVYTPLKPSWLGEEEEWEEDDEKEEEEKEWKEEVEEDEAVRGKVRGKGERCGEHRPGVLLVGASGDT